MRIAVASTISWPYVRRGSRFPYELAAYLAGRGHEVHYLTTKPGDFSRTKQVDGFVAEYHRLGENLLMAGLGIEKFDTFAWSCLGSLLRKDFDIVQTFFPMEAFAAAFNKFLRGTPFVHLMIDCFQQPYYITPHGERMMRRSVKHASRLVVISQFINRDTREKFGLQGMVIPVTVDTEQFFPGPRKEGGRPKILFASSQLDPRKRFVLLVGAFVHVLDSQPDAVLQLAGHCHPLVKQHLREKFGEKVFRSIEILGVGDRKDLPSLYRNASVTVLPSLNEAFGMVLLESLASGTPVVGTRSGGIPEIINDPGIGVLFEPTEGPKELGEAILACLRLARDPQTATRCARHVQEYSWASIGPRYESLYEDILAAQKPRGKNKVRAGTPPEGKRHVRPLLSRLAGGDWSRRQRLRDRFTDAVDGLEISYDTYFKVTRHEPRCLFAFHWLSRRGPQSGKALLAGPFPLPFSVLAREKGFSVTEIDIAEKPSGSADPLAASGASGPPDLDAAEGPFDVIVLDDLNIDGNVPRERWQRIKGALSPGGVLLLMIPNAPRAFRGLHRRLEKGMQMFSGVLPSPPGMPVVHRDRQVEALLSEAGFLTVDRRYVSGLKISGGYLSLPLSYHLLNLSLRGIHRLLPSCRSHFFVAAVPLSTPSGTKEAR